MKFIIEDDAHAEWCGEYDTFDAALNELVSRSKISWDKKPNVCPCTSWKTCGREYSIIEYDESSDPWTEVSNEPIFSISAKGLKWHYNLPNK